MVRSVRLRKMFKHGWLASTPQCNAAVNVDVMHGEIDGAVQRDPDTNGYENSET